jgi:hypothetical protein
MLFNRECRVEKDPNRAEREAIDNILFAPRT